MPEHNQSYQKSKWLVLIPTEFERKFIVDLIPPSRSVTVEVCGFGPIVSAARTVQLIQRFQPNHVLLIGIAGGYDERLTVGSAYLFFSVGCYGVGAGTGKKFETAEKMGWHHWLDPSSNGSIGDTILLSTRKPKHYYERIQQQLLTVCAAAANAQDVEQRLEKFPVAVAEDMEGFAVAAACELCKCPVSIIRGISNRAGERDTSRWEVSAAMVSAMELACQMIGMES